jgi:D-alanyl-D-alanine carboxypeptidase
VSANVAAYALAEATSGSVEQFAKDEAETAKRYGMSDSTFADPAGLDDEQSYGGGPRMSAYDIAIAARNTLAVPELALFSAQRQLSFVDPTGAQRSLINHNRMLPGGTRAYDGTTGMKTGYTNRAGHTFVATATRNGRTLIAVVLNTYDTFGWAQQLLDQGFATPRRDKGTGATVPPVEVSPYGQRVTDRDGFLALTGTPGASVAAATAGTATSTPGESTSVSTTVTTTAPSAGRASGGDETTASAAASTSDSPNDGGGPGWFSVRNIVIVVVVLLAALFLLRRRAVRRQRARRLAKRRAVRAAMRRGSLPVVDGRYRSGARFGPPVESHVRIHRVQRPPGKAG